MAAEKAEVLTCLVVELQGGWEFLGVGTGGSEGMMFLRHPCGFGPEVEEEDDEEKSERSRDEQGVWESDENDDSDEDSDEDNAEDSDGDVDEEDFDLLGGHLRGVFQNLNRERADEVNRGRRYGGRAENNLDRGRQRERVRDADNRVRARARNVPLMRRDRQQEFDQAGMLDRDGMFDEDGIPIYWNHEPRRHHRRNL